MFRGCPEMQAKKGKRRANSKGSLMKWQSVREKWPKAKGEVKI